MKRSWRLLIALVMVSWANGSSAEEARLLRFPAISRDTIAFTYGGDLYTVSADGGVARKITSHEGVEIFPRFSPDGKSIAFTGQYDGNTEVYLIPSEGGIPKRLTYTATLGRDELSDRMGPNNIVLGWKNDGKHIVFRSRMIEHNDFIGQLFLVSVNGDLPEQLPLPRGGFCAYSPDDSKLVYNRVFREFRTWKRYRGGMADDLWLYDFATKKTENLTNTPDQEIIPMWHGNKIYFLSDRDNVKRMNLYSYDLTSKEVKQHTSYTEFDIKFPSIGKDAIVYENGGYIYKFDLQSEKDSKVSIQIHDDMASSRSGLRNVASQIADADISPDGKRALFAARGDIFTVPAKDGATRNLTNTQGVHERDPVWSPDGKWIAYVSDESGETEIHVRPQAGGPSRQLTTGADTYKYRVDWSPDSKKLLWGDKKLRLQFVDVESKQVTQVAQSTESEYNQFHWSPDSKWITYAQSEAEGMPRVYLYSLDTKKSTAVTDGWQSASSPCFSGDGKYLFFVSARDFNPTTGETEYNFIYQNMSRPYFLTLAADTPSPFKPKSDEVEIAPDTPKPAKNPDTMDSFMMQDKVMPAEHGKRGQKTDAKPEDSKDKKPEAPKKKEPVVVKVDLEGIKERVIQIPVEAGRYGGLNSVGDKVYYFKGGRGGGGLAMYDLTAKKETMLGQVFAYSISSNQRKMLIRQANGFSIIDLPMGPIAGNTPLNTSGVEMMLDRRAEWKQIFVECWRQMRDFLFDPNMHKVDWKLMRQRYEPLVDHAVTRQDLSYVIGEMIAELNIGHAYVGSGDIPKVEKIPLGLLGAQLVRDPGTNYVKIARIIRGEIWNPKQRSPLVEPGVGVKEGDFILAINGIPTTQLPNPYAALINTVGKQVTLKVNSKGAEDGAREVTVVPIADEHPLYYHNWVESNIRKVSLATEGKVGYLHIPDMLPDGYNEFAKRFYPQLRKKALIVDVRGNGGGNVSPIIIERLRREAAMIAVSRNGAPRVEPADLLDGPKVCLLNEFSASDGDIFPYRFRHYKLGKLIGKRSWGGVVGIRGPLPLLDSGDLRKPEFSRYDLEGKEWIMEGHGVDPDIVVDNDPAREYEGVDDQLNKGIEVILEELKTKERSVPPLPPYPDKSK